MIADVCKPGAIAFVCMDWRHVVETIAAGKMRFGDLLNLCVWNKTNAGMGSLYRSQHELVLVFRNGTEPHRNNVELGKHGRHRSNVWTYRGANSFGADRMEDLNAHPTVKPISLVADALLMSAAAATSCSIPLADRARRCWLPTRPGARLGSSRSILTTAISSSVASRSTQASR